MICVSVVNTANVTVISVVFAEHAADAVATALSGEAFLHSSERSIVAVRLSSPLPDFSLEMFFSFRGALEIFV